MPTRRWGSPGTPGTPRPTRTPGTPGTRRPQRTGRTPRHPRTERTTINSIAIDTLKQIMTPKDWNISNSLSLETYCFVIVPVFLCVFLASLFVFCFFFWHWSHILHGIMATFFFFSSGWNTNETIVIDFFASFVLSSRCNNLYYKLYLVIVVFNNDGLFREGDNLLVSYWIYVLRVSFFCRSRWSAFGNMQVNNSDSTKHVQYFFVWK